MDKLKPCPFCGGEAQILVDVLKDYPATYLPCCTKCDGMVEKWFPTEKEAIDAWNRRWSDG